MYTYFPSKKSTALGIIIWGILLGVFGFVIYELSKDDSPGKMILTLSILIVTLLFNWIVWFRTGYFLSTEYLIVKIGPVTHSKISISKISKISRSNSILASPANSFKRLAIKSGKSALVLISPKDEKEFIELITKINPNITVDLK